MQIAFNQCLILNSKSVANSNINVFFDRIAYLRWNKKIQICFFLIKMSWLKNVFMLN